ncbi:Wzz/FepE/Etk N-terminal domain-containing protein [Metasolibacillus meyeri]|uniref:Wzz/FepE/Etk N-terminal domain-containing protein n=1 Tax=Metasolibacillus meyeri TaxID=1071052 RepID=A0AAW9NNZ0_9BACL|nr:Wzz/FepE/Etk N-terminal domain-containing protein [Metasolibacillus meyeri]MEC1177740.1 Wzz/FepE/Etk N-terminal domain-containing protein [Metasolibacillus meyeri]
MEETIELRELINIIWRGKAIIIISTITCMLIATILNWFILEEKYESKAVIQVVSTAQDIGVISNYINAEFTPAIYSERIQNKFLMRQAIQDEIGENQYIDENLRVLLDPNPNKNSLEIKYISDSPESAQQYLRILMNATKSDMNKSVQETMKELDLVYKNELDTLTQEVEQVVNTYNKLVRDNNLPEILILQTIINSEINLNISDQQMEALANVTEGIQNQLLQLQAMITSKSTEYGNVLVRYQSIQTGIASFKPDSFIRIIIEPTLEEDSVSPNKLLNLVISSILGIMMGLCIVFFRYYWKPNSSIK